MVGDPEYENAVVNVELVAPDTAVPFRYHWYAYDPVPAEPVAVKVMEFPMSVGFCELVTDTEGSELTDSSSDED